MTQERGRPGQGAGPANTAANCDPKPNTAGSQQRLVSSKQVSWWDVHEHVAPHLAAAGTWPTAGTPEWCDLPDDHPAKLAALLDAAQHWALRVETCQQAECQASHDISAAADWATIAQHIRDRDEFYSARPRLKRASA